MSRRLAATVAAAAWLVAAAAPASDLWKSADGRTTLEGRAFYKVLATGIGVSDGLVDVTSELQRALDEARALLPPEAGGQLPTGLRVPDLGALNGHVARLEAKVVHEDWLTLEVAWQLNAAVASHPAFTAGASFTSTLGGTGPAASRRMFDFEPLLLERPGVRVDHNLDRLALRLDMPIADVIVGRQVLSWGTGRMWNPTDLLSPFSPTEIDREIRRGIDAVRVSIPLSSEAQLELVWLPQPAFTDHGGAIRAQANLLGYDFSLSAAKYTNDVVLGADFAGDLGALGVHGEAAYTLGLRNLELGAPAPDVGERALRAVVGAEVRLTDKLMLSGEYYFNGWGATDAAAYARAMASPRVQRGEVFGAGRHYLGLVAAIQATELLSLQLLGLVNLQDPSAYLMPALEYWFEQSVIVRAGAYVPLGEEPDPSAFRRLTGLDVLAGSDAWRDATGTLGLRSEYGLTSFGVFGQVGLYFQ